MEMHNAGLYEPSMQKSPAATYVLASLAIESLALAQASWYVK